LGEVVKFREDGQVTFTERVNVEADSLVTTQSSSVIAASTTNANLVIAPNGTGALVADIPDGTATGGDARGENSVDLQMSRTASDQVSGGNFSSILGGIKNRIRSASTHAYNTIVGGQTNDIFGSGSIENNNINGGLTNTIQGANTSQSNIGGGASNIVSSSYSTVSGGQSNTASTNTHATVVGGQSNTSSGQWSVSGGQSNTASGQHAVSFGQSNTSSGLQSTSFGINNSNSGDYSFGIGYRTVGYLYGQFQSGNGFISGVGDAQQSSLTARREATLTTGGTTVLSLDGTGTTNLIIPSGNNRMWNVQVRWVAVVTTITGTATGVTVGDTKTSTDLLAVAKRGGVTTVSAHTSAGTHAIETIAGSLTAANITYTAGGSQEMQITFTAPTFAGGGSVTMRIVAAISLTEVAY
jgi:hypothetical protein